MTEMSAPQKEKSTMPTISLTKEAPGGSAGISPPRTWAGTLVKAGEAVTYYLHLKAFPCEKCKGPVVDAWIGTRENDISSETETTEVGAVCLVCGRRPDALIEPLRALHFRPVEWEWSVENKSAALEPDGDPLTAELSQDADRPD
jgi:hypothetical protein